MSRVEQEVSDGVGLVDRGHGRGLSLQRQQSMRQHLLAVRVCGSRRADERG